MEVTWEQTGLLPNHDYDIYFYLMNMNQIPSIDPAKLRFRTNDLDRIAIIQLKLKQTSISKDVKQDYIQKMEDLVSISKLLIEYKPNCTYADPLLIPIPGYSFFNLLILPDPLNENPLISPLIKANELNDRRAEI